MQVLLPLFILWLLPLTATKIIHPDLIARPRKFFQFDDAGVKLVTYKDGAPSLFMLIFKNKNRHIMLVGAKNTIFIHNVKDIRIYGQENWESLEEDVRKCRNTGNPWGECTNFVRYLYPVGEDSLMACGTSAFKPTCKEYRFDEDGYLTFEKKFLVSGFGKIPYDSQQSFANANYYEEIFSANFLDKEGKRPAFIRNVFNRQKVVTRDAEGVSFKDPTFTSAEIIYESAWGTKTEPDKILLLFSESAVDFDCRDDRKVSRLGRMCAKDIGNAAVGPVVVTFQKATINCSIMVNELPSIVQNSYLLCVTNKKWTDCVLYAIFTPQIDAFKDHVSAVCRYDMTETTTMFSRTGTFKTRVDVPFGSVWLDINKKLPVPRPGTCITGDESNMEKASTLNLPLNTVNFAIENPLMNEVIEPMGSKPVLIREGSTFTSIVVTEVRDTTFKAFYVMFIGTASGTLVKAVHFFDNAFIVDEIQVFPNPVPIKSIELAVSLDQIYVLSPIGVAQVPLARCEQSKTCVDCVLARDPYCGWDTALKKCVRLKKQEKASNVRKLLQSVSSADASQCPKANVTAKTVFVLENSYLKLDCETSSSFAAALWEKDNVKVQPSHNLRLVENTLIIFAIALDQGGEYRCTTTERVLNTRHVSSIVNYNVHVNSRLETCGEDTIENCTILQEQLKWESRQRRIILYSILPVFGIICFVFLAQATYGHFRKRSQEAITMIQSHFSSTHRSLDVTSSSQKSNKEATASLQLDDLSLAPESPAATNRTKRKAQFAVESLDDK